MSHATEHITDVRVRRLRVSSRERAIVFGWDYPGATLLEVRILRSSSGFADGPDDAERPVSGQELVYQGVTGSFRDTAVTPGETYCYTVYAQHRRREAAEAAAPGGDAGAEALPSVGGVDAASAAGGEADGGWVLWGRERVRAT